ncbi:hypothetical protein [Paenibacillus glycanilyticus]|uniref:DUF4367 domain-containing protein n=1 Tax=Paenibacillus glycanilyticus TaxID=126569 RepID=A0ABQ6GEI9_9BACL|nr:hypothetical protein [Paenibacillus glycanilyticus]GLX68660.1 hypothetical protein MU1_30050 [Paenibacillus glycanilyticus]
MARSTNMAKDQDIMRYAKADADYRDIDLTQSVMKRIYLLNVRNSKVKRRISFQRSTVAVALSAVMLLGALTAYAANEFIQIRDSKGRTVIETVQPGPVYSFPAEVSKQFEAYRQRVLAQLQPGQMIAYYIHDDKLNAYDKLNPIKFESNTSYISYAEYLHKLKQVSAPQLEIPDDLPKGYLFKLGQISPRPPMRGDKDHSAYDKLQTELLSRAAAAKGSGDKLVMMPVEWTNTLGVNLNFSNGTSYINVMAQNGPDHPEHGGKASFSQSPNVKSESIWIGDQEALFMKDDDREAANPHLLSWYDESSNIYYSIMDSQGSKLTKENIIQIARSIIEQENR